MNKKLLIFGLIVMIATGLYINGLLAHDNVVTTAAGTNITVPYKDIDSQNISNGEVFATAAYDQFTYVIAFNATENPEMYQELANIVCKGQRYKDSETGVVFYQEVSTELVNSHRFMGGDGLALKDSYFNGGIMLNNETGECIICVSTIRQDVIDVLSSVEWGNKTVKIDNTVNTTASVEEPVYEDTTAETNNIDNDADKKIDDTADKKIDDTADKNKEWSDEHSKEMEERYSGVPAEEMPQEAIDDWNSQFK